jgi:hypothetical protein
VAPILVEATEPRGGNLYMLADRNWIRLAPEPLDQIDLLTEHLATLAGKDVTPSVAGETRTMFVPAAANDGIPAPPANDDEAGPQQPLDQALGEFLHGTDRPAKAAPKVAGAYVGSASRPGTPRGSTAGGLPLRRGDFIALGFVLTAVVAVALNQGPFGSGAEAGFIAAAWMMLAVLACAALVLPVRSFLGWRSPMEALASYAISVAALYSGLAVIGVIGAQLGYFTWEGLRYDLSLAATVLAAYTVAAFALYGVLARRRAIRSFRSNIRTL